MNLKNSRVFFPILYILFTILIVWLYTLIPVIKLPSFLSFLSGDLGQLLLFFWIFYALPISLAYYVAFNHFKQFNKSPNHNVLYAFSVTLVLLGLLFTANYLYSRTPKTDTSFTQNPHITSAPSPSHSSISTPTPRIFKPFSKPVNPTYYITENNSLPYLYSPSETLVWKDPLPFILDTMSDFYFDSTNNRIFLSQTNAPINSYDELSVYSFDPNSGYHKQVLNLFHHTADTHINILSYYPSVNELLILNSGGDGCGSWGNLWFIPFSEKPRLLRNFAAGCANSGNLPDYIGFFSDQLIFTTYNLVNSEHDSAFDAPIESIYSLNPLTAAETILIGPSQIPPGTVYVNLKTTPQSRLLILHDSNSQSWTFDLITHTLSSN